MKSLVDKITASPWFYPLSLVFCIAQGAMGCLLALNLAAALWLRMYPEAFYSALLLGGTTLVIWNFWRVTRPDNELLKMPEMSK